MTDFLKFVADCEALLERDGEAGNYYPNSKIFDSPGIKIVAHGERQLDISIKYFIAGGRVLTNPVVMRDEAGKIYRQHGEWIYGVDRVTDLLMGKTFDMPITRG